MKKIIFLITFLLLILPLMTCANEMDSVTLSQFENEKLGVSEDEVVVKVYNGLFMHGFAEHKNINELIKEPYVIADEYVILEDEISGNYDYMINRKGNFEMLLGIDTGKLFFEYATSPDLIFEKNNMSVIVDSVYCLDGSPSMDGIIIYYVTNQGDYIYYKEYLESDKEYIFPLDSFYDYAEKVQAERLNNQGKDGEFGVYTQYDISLYEIGNKNNSNDYILICSAVAFVIVIALLILYVMKKKHLLK